MLNINFIKRQQVTLNMDLREICKNLKMEQSAWFRMLNTRSTKWTTVIKMAELFKCHPFDLIELPPEYSTNNVYSLVSEPIESYSCKDCIEKSMVIKTLIANNDLLIADLKACKKENKR